MKGRPTTAISFKLAMMIFSRRETVQTTSASLILFTFRSDLNEHYDKNLESAPIHDDVVTMYIL